MHEATCRFCGTALDDVVINLGVSPLANSYVEAARLQSEEPAFPLQVFVCKRCYLVQLEEYENAEGIFSDYSYFSSYSDSWLAHSEEYVQMAIRRFELGPASKVVEVASNDGYLLQYFVKARIPVLGVEPAANVAKVAVEKGIPTEVAFFGKETARRLAAQGHRADLTAANNVLAHVPDINDFVAGFRILLKEHGVSTFEFPHLLNLIEESQFDTIYHEHFSYLSLKVVQRIFAHHGLTVFDVEELPTHGGSLRVYARLEEDGSRPVEPAVAALIARETRAGLERIETYRAFQPKVERVKSELLKFLTEAKAAGKQVAGYGAPAKGNTLLNYCGVGTELIAYTVDRSPHKQGRFLPGSHIPIYGPEKISETRPAYVLILPWNLKDEIAKSMSHIRAWGGEFVTVIPHFQKF